MAARAERLAEALLHEHAASLVFLARLLLVATFIEDGLRLWLQRDEQAAYFARAWAVPPVLAALFLAYNLLAQLSGAAMVLARRRVVAGVALLASVVLLQVPAAPPGRLAAWPSRRTAHPPIPGPRFRRDARPHARPSPTRPCGVAPSSCGTLRARGRAMRPPRRPTPASVRRHRALAMAGGLLLLLAEAWAINRVAFAGIPLPELPADRRKSHLQLGGRVLLTTMFFTLLHGEPTPVRIASALVGAVLTGCVAFGYKARLNASALVVLMLVANVFLHPWWTLPEWDLQRDFVRYDFFQLLSVAGGILLVAVHGPGSISIDDRKKRF